MGSMEVPQVSVDEALIEELTTRAVSQVFPSTEELQDELRTGRRLTAYMGIDPTAPDMHVGHESQLLKLRRLQEMGHHVILLIGDFTAMIGDPTDKSAARVKLSREEVLANAEGYRDQAGKILDIDNDANPIDVRFNSQWLGGMDFADVLELASEFTVQQMLERDMFERRIEDGKPVGLHEFLYPMMQGYDSLAMEVDIEVGGSDQIFNMLVGSTLVRRHLDKKKFVIAGDLLVDPSGKKIGKTEGNMITLNDDPLSMFHKVMMWGDDITPHALELCTTMPMEEVRELESRMARGEVSGIEGKLLLARRIVGDLHGEDAANNAQAEYEIISKSANKLDPERFEVMNVTEGQGILDVLVGSGIATSKSHARRLIEQNGVRINDETVGMDWVCTRPAEGNVILQVGKRRLENHRVLSFAPDGDK